MDLDETLVHSQFKPVQNPDYVIPIELEGRIQDIYVLKRPFCDEFLHRVCQLFEVVLYTASLGKYASPLIELMDPSKKTKFRLFRNSCTFYRGVYVKDLTKLGRNLNRIIIIDNSPNSYLF